MPGLNADEWAEIARLHKQVRMKEMESEILDRTSAYVA